MAQARQTCQGASRTVSAALLCLCLVLGISTPSGAQEETENQGNVPSFKVMTFNIRVGFGVKYPDLSPWELRKSAKRIPPIVAAIRSIDPDIIGLQEVYGAGQARQIAKALGMKYEYAPHPSESQWWGLALLSKYPIQDCKQNRSSATRGVMVCTVSIADHPITVINIHKNHKITDGSSTNAIVRIARNAPSPVVLLGDFNVSPIEPRYDAVTRYYADTAVITDTENARTALIEGTFSNGDRIDYIFVDTRFFSTNDAGISTEEYWAASDHLGYYATLKFRE